MIRIETKSTIYYFKRDEVISLILDKDKQECRVEYKDKTLQIKGVVNYNGIMQQLER